MLKLTSQWHEYEGVYSSWGLDEVAFYNSDTLSMGRTKCGFGGLPRPLNHVFCKTGASGSPVFPGHERDPLMCFSGGGRKELSFEGCWSDVGPTVPEIWAISRDNISNLSLGPISHVFCKTGASGFPVLPKHVRDRLRCSTDSRRKELSFEGCWSDVGPTVPEIEAISRVRGVSRIDFLAKCENLFLVISNMFWGSPVVNLT